MSSARERSSRRILRMQLAVARSSHDPKTFRRVQLMHTARGKQGSEERRLLPAAARAARGISVRPSCSTSDSRARAAEEVPEERFAPAIIGGIDASLKAFVFVPIIDAW